MDLHFQDVPKPEDKYKEIELARPAPFGDTWDINNVHDTGRKGDPHEEQPKSIAQGKPATAPKEFSHSSDRGFIQDTVEFGLNLKQKPE